MMNLARYVLLTLFFAAPIQAFASGAKSILMVVTSHDRIDAEHPTGLWLEEFAVQLTDKMPFLLETRLTELGAEFTGADNFAEHVVTDGNLITGQNPASSKAAAEALLMRLSE